MRAFGITSMFPHNGEKLPRFSKLRDKLGIPIVPFAIILILALIGDRSPIAMRALAFRPKFTRQPIIATRSHSINARSEHPDSRPLWAGMGGERSFA